MLEHFTIYVFVFFTLTYQGTEIDKKHGTKLDDPTLANVVLGVGLYHSDIKAFVIPLNCSGSFLTCQTKH